MIEIFIRGGGFMSDLSEDLKKLKFDKRMIKWNMRQKLLTEKEYKQHLGSLEDVSHLKNTDEVMSFNEEESEAEDNTTDTDS